MASSFGGFEADEDTAILSPWLVAGGGIGIVKSVSASSPVVAKARVRCEWWGELGAEADTATEEEAMPCA